MKNQSAEDLVKGLRRRGGHLPTKLSEKRRREKEREKKNNEQGYEVLEVE